MNWGQKCKSCGASRDYIKNTKTGWKCSICGNTWKRYKGLRKEGVDILDKKVKEEEEVHNES